MSGPDECPHRCCKTGQPCHHKGPAGEIKPEDCTYCLSLPEAASDSLRPGPQGAGG